MKLGDYPPRKRTEILYHIREGSTIEVKTDDDYNVELVQGMAADGEVQIVQEGDTLKVSAP